MSGHIVRRQGRDRDHDKGVLLIIALICLPVVVFSGLIAWLA